MGMCLPCIIMVNPDSIATTPNSPSSPIRNKP